MHCINTVMVQMLAVHCINTVMVQMLAVAITSCSEVSSLRRS